MQRRESELRKLETKIRNVKTDPTNVTAAYSDRTPPATARSSGPRHEPGSSSALRDGVQRRSLLPMRAKRRSFRYRDKPSEIGRSGTTANVLAWQTRAQHIDLSLFHQRLRLPERFIVQPIQNASPIEQTRLPQRRSVTGRTPGRKMKLKVSILWIVSLISHRRQATVRNITTKQCSNG